ncbi:protein JTB [Lingula anatina]|uniref:Protein JTB n=1 Tax=Lingula anatina TaxID=7574 RepID=A0A1S3H4Y2_LINAN|nr:protein JTB [Lingula anatina]|eukprot:XP_013381027.1 protein JTB [Lingula anatina]
MIEFCTPKRMTVAIFVLIVVSVLVLFLENHFSGHIDLKNVTHLSENQSEANVCQMTGKKYVIVDECRHCTPFEMKHKVECQQTGYYEKVKCGGKEKYHSCPKIHWMEERDYWVFEGVSLTVGLVSYGVVHIRRKRLDRLLMEKVNKQIASGV